MDFWLEACDRLNLPEFKSCRKMLATWRRYILNAFDIHLSNGFTEGYNNAIKTLKRLAFSFGNFSTFRARILIASRVRKEPGFEPPWGKRKVPAFVSKAGT